MVQVKTIDKFIEKSPEIAKEARTEPEIAKRVMEVVKMRIEKNRRKPREPVPKGSISIRAASIKYQIPNQTISYWAKRGYIQIVKETNNWKYISEQSLLDLIKLKNYLPGKKLHGITPAYCNTNMGK